jgi:hypothetical protein
MNKIAIGMHKPSINGSDITPKNAACLLQLTLIKTPCDPIIELAHETAGSQQRPAF